MLYLDYSQGRRSRDRARRSHHLRAHILELVLQLDLLGDGDAILGDARRPDFLPAPSMIVVFSFSMRTRLALPSI